MRAYNFHILSPTETITLTKKLIHFFQFTPAETEPRYTVMTTTPVANHPNIFTHRSPPSTSSSPALLFLNRTNFIPYFSTSKRNSVNCNGWRTRCSVAKDYTAPPSEVDGGGSGNHFSELDCVVVGGGISGLCIAKVISANYPNLMMTEARDRAGGNITTVERDGYLWEEGPNSFQPSDPMLTMAVDCGLKDDLVLGDPDAPRFVLWEGKLRPVPAKPTDLPFFDLMSIPGKLRAGFGAIGLRPSPPVCTLPHFFVSLNSTLMHSFLLIERLYVCSGFVWYTGWDKHGYLS